MTTGYYENTENSNIKVNHSSAAQFRYRVHPTPGAIYRDASPHAASHAYEIKSCRVALFIGFISPILPPANCGTPGTTHVNIIKSYF